MTKWAPSGANPRPLRRGPRGSRLRGSAPGAPRRPVLPSRRPPAPAGRSSARWRTTPRGGPPCGGRAPDCATSSRYRQGMRRAPATPWRRSVRPAPPAGRAGGCAHRRPDESDGAALRRHGARCRTAWPPPAPPAPYRWRSRPAAWPHVRDARAGDPRPRPGRRRSPPDSCAPHRSRCPSSAPGCSAAWCGPCRCTGTGSGPDRARDPGSHRWSRRSPCSGRSGRRTWRLGGRVPSASRRTAPIR